MDTKLASVVEFEVDADVPHKTLTRATEEGLAAARAIVAGAEANGSLGSARGARRRVRIELSLRVGDGGPASGLRAERAFAEAFLARVGSGGAHAARL